MTEHATTATASTTTDLFEIMRTTRSMRRLKPDPVDALSVGLMNATIVSGTQTTTAKLRFDRGRCRI
jgi:hypothetical protein